MSFLITEQKKIIQEEEISPGIQEEQKIIPVMEMSEEQLLAEKQALIGLYGKIKWDDFNRDHYSRYEEVTQRLDQLNPVKYRRGCG
jgi:hypothetical protein